MSTDRKKRRPSEIEDDLDQGSNQRNTKVRFNSKVDSAPFVGNIPAGNHESEYEEEEALRPKTNIKVRFLLHPLVPGAKSRINRSWLSTAAH